MGGLREEGGGDGWIEGGREVGRGGVSEGRKGGGDGWSE